MPAVSVLMPVFNCAPYLTEAILSVKNQSFTDFEFIIVNDGSTDESLQIIEQFAASDARFAVITHANSGIVRSLNVGLEKCRGEFVARMDGDDVCFPERLETQLRFMLANPGFVACGTTVESIDQNGNHLHIMDVPRDTKGIINACLNEVSAGICHPTAMIRIAALRSISGYRGRGYEDADLMLRLSEIGELANLDYVGLKYRRRPGQITRSYNYEQTIAAIEVLSLYQREKQFDLAKSRSNLHVKAAWQKTDLGERRVAWRHVLNAIRLNPLGLKPWRAMARFLFTSVFHHCSRCEAKKLNSGVG